MLWADWWARCGWRLRSEIEQEVTEGTESVGKFSIQLENFGADSLCIRYMRKLRR